MMNKTGSHFLQLLYFYKISNVYENYVSVMKK